MTDVLLAGPVFFVNYIKGSFVCRTSSNCKGPALNRRKRYTVDNPQVTYKVPEFDRRSSVPRKCLGLSWYASASDSTV